MSKKNKISLNEAFKISLEIDPKQFQDLEQASESRIRNRSHGGKFESYVRDLGFSLGVQPSLLEAARDVHDMVETTIETVSLREDKRASRMAEAMATEKVLRNWRAFLRELADFERRFGK